jgi:NAD(P)H-hydrate epimerase
MERAGTAVAREAMRAFPRARRFVAVCGGGSNGGDGRIAARALEEAGREAVVLEAAEPELELLDGADVVVDALFGTGFSGAPRPEAAALVEAVNATGASVVAVDVASGVDASTGEVAGPAVRADLTVAIAGRKVGHAVAPGRFHSGRVVVVDIGLERSETALVRGTDVLLRSVPRRAPGDTKYTAGSVLVVGGSPGMTGAVCLAAHAALRADAGYVAVCVPEASLPVVEARLLEPVKHGWPAGAALVTCLAAAEKARAVAIGPGLGRSDEARALVRALLERLDVPAVVDADGLFGLEPVERTAPTVLTPHAGELGRLLGEEAAWVDAHRLEAATRAASAYRATILLKGADTIVAAADGPRAVVDLGPPSLATAGTGDVLTGVIGAFLAKGLDGPEAAIAGATAHGVAAGLAPHQAGLVAGDVAELLPAALS